ncbi:IS3 family transposase [Vaginisenegalia massiliensis]|uniref:IS3 family transposase n=1 Tax=Vaginisenegalia massiliensis TaxID=2058294 RepID=UPI001F14D04B|nr:IS3 family transposase [Vaginisenegalia massiliensis]
MGCATQGEKAAIIKELHQEEYQLKYLLRAMKLAKSTYYFELNKVDKVKEKNLPLEQEIRAIFEKHQGRYGVRRIYHELRNTGIIVNHKRVQRLMHHMNLFGKRPKEKYHSYRGQVGKVASNIINRNFSASAPFQKWTTDVSQFTFPWGKCYLSPILDMATNEIMAYDLSPAPNMKQITNMLDQAFTKYPILNGLIFHSDQGWQYQHKSFRTRLKERGIVQSMSRKGNCYDNSIMETFFGRLKNELFYGQEKSYHSFDEFKSAVATYIDYYNHERIQEKTKWMPPVKFRMASMA